MEAIGLLLGLAPLFSICLEYFDYFKTTQTLCEEFELLLLKLDLEHERFIAWGEANGISKPADEGRNPELDSPPKAKLIQRSLEAIRSLFENSKKLQAEYGLRAFNGPSLNDQKPKFPSSSGLSRFRRSYAKLSRDTNSPAQPSIISRTRWQFMTRQSL